MTPIENQTHYTSIPNLTLYHWTTDTTQCYIIMLRHAPPSPTQADMADVGNLRGHPLFGFRSTGFCVDTLLSFLDITGVDETTELLTSAVVAVGTLNTADFGIEIMLYGVPCFSGRRSPACGGCRKINR